MVRTVDDWDVRSANRISFTGNYSNLLGYGDNKDMSEYLRLYIAIHGDHEGGNASAHTARKTLSFHSFPFCQLNFPCRSSRFDFVRPIHRLRCFTLCSCRSPSRVTRYESFHPAASAHRDMQTCEPGSSQMAVEHATGSRRQRQPRKDQRIPLDDLEERTCRPWVRKTLPTSLLSPVSEMMFPPLAGMVMVF